MSRVPRRRRSDARRKYATDVLHGHVRMRGLFSTPILLGGLLRRQRAQGQGRGRQRRGLQGRRPPRRWIELIRLLGVQVRRATTH